MNNFNQNPSVRMQPLTLAVLLWAAIPGDHNATLHAMDIFNQSNARHGRLTSSSDDLNRRFLFYEYNPSGLAVNQDTLANAGRAAMITSRHFVTTDHTAGTHPNTVTFLTQSGILSSAGRNYSKKARKSDVFPRISEPKSGLVSVSKLGKSLKPKQECGSHRRSERVYPAIQLT